MFQSMMGKRPKTSEVPACPPKKYTTIVKYSSPFYFLSPPFFSSFSCLLLRLLLILCLLFLLLLLLPLCLSLLFLLLHLLSLLCLLRLSSSNSSDFFFFVFFFFIFFIVIFFYYFFFVLLVSFFVFFVVFLVFLQFFRLLFLLLHLHCLLLLLFLPLRLFFFFFVILSRGFADQWSRGHEYVFPPLSVSPEVGEWREERGLVLTLKAPALGTFSSCSSKQLYSSCVKVLNFSLLAGVRESKWTEVLGSDFSPGGSWRVLYKPPVEKRMADLQWRIIHGAIATNRYRAHLDPHTGEGCPFCSLTETLDHLVVSCPRLVDVLKCCRSGWGAWERCSLFPSLSLDQNTHPRKGKLWF